MNKKNQLNSELMNLLLIEIKFKKQINDLEDNFILDKINQFFLRNGDKRKQLEKEFNKIELEIRANKNNKNKNNKTKIKKKIIRNKILKEIIKSIREEIGIIYGSYLTKDFKKKEKILNKIEGINLEKLDKNEIKSLLFLHKSTRERVDYYEEIYEKIFNWYKPKIILDIACGLNPISTYYIIKYYKSKKLNPPKYYSTDLNPKDMDFLNEFFNKYNINGKAKNYDITTLEILKDEEFQKADLVFLFKALDSFEQIKKNISKELLIGLKAKRIIISFPTKSLISKKEFKIEKRNWLFNFLDKMNWNYEKFEIENELFIMISKN